MRAAVQQRGEDGRRFDHLLDVVHHEQMLPRAKMRDEPVQQRPAPDLTHAEGAGNRRQHQIRIAHRFEIDEDHSVGEFRHGIRGDLQCQPGLADPARPGQRHERHVLPPQQFANQCDLTLAADQQRPRSRRRCRRSSWWRRRNQTQLRTIGLRIRSHCRRRSRSGASAITFPSTIHATPILSIDRPGIAPSALDSRRDLPRVRSPSGASPRGVAYPRHRGSASMADPAGGPGVTVQRAPAGAWMMVRRSNSRRCHHGRTPLR